MFQFFFLCLKKFGWTYGLPIYLRVKVVKSKKIFLPGLNQPIYYRPNTADIDTFREIFFREEYAVSVTNPIVIIDAGANIGFTSLFFAKQHPSATIFSLEPDKENFNYLKRNSINTPRIKPIQAALWNKEGTIEVVDKGYGVRGYIVEDSPSINSPTSMNSTTLVALIQRYNLTAIDILKIDIEGSEKEVFSVETDKWLPLTKCLIIELHDRMKSGCSQAVFSALANYNFECSIRGENLVFINQDL